MYLYKTRRAIAGVIVASVIVASIAGTASAQTPAQSVAELIATLQAQIAALQTQIAALKTAQQGVASAQQDVAGTLQLLGDLKEGMLSNDVALLQAALASDTSVYPEGLVTGFYGRATKEAVKRFQKRHGLPVTGFAGPLTRGKLNSIIIVLPIAQESASASAASSTNVVRFERDDDDGDDRDNDHDLRHGRDKSDYRYCLSVPPGHLIAEGWKKNKGKGKNDETILPFCKKLPWGIEKKLSPSGTTTPPTPPPAPDTVAPTISALAVSGVTHNSATVSWTTNEAAKSAVYLGTTSPVSTATATWTDTNVATTHAAILSGLSTATAYRYIVKATDASGNSVFSTEGTFTTAAAPDTTPPTISALSAVTTGSTTAAVSWTTNESATTKLYYATTSPLLKTSASVFEALTLETAHFADIGGLVASTTYYAVAESKDATGNTVSSNEISFATAR